MEGTGPTPELLDDAVEHLVRRWSLTPRAASAAIADVADELDLDVGDLAALVVAAHQQYTQLTAWAEPSRRPASGLALVTTEASAMATSRTWVLRSPEGSSSGAGPGPVEPAPLRLVPARSEAVPARHPLVRRAR